MAVQDRPERKSQEDKNIVMCLSPGRCGTNLLALLLGLAEDTHAEHEPVPGFHSIIDSLRDTPDAALPFVRDVKLPAIHAYKQHNYVETSHLFGKGFFDAFLELGVDFRLIILDRDPREVARSLRRVKAIPARSVKRAKYLLHPDQGDVMGLPGWQGMSDYQLCFWYALEMERRKDVYAAACARQGVPMTRISMDDMLDFDRLRDFAAELGLLIPARAVGEHARITAQKINRKSRYLPKLSLVPAARQEDAVWQALGNAAAPLYDRVCSRYGWQDAGETSRIQEGVVNG